MEKKDLEKLVAKMVRQDIDSTFNVVHQLMKTRSGDISPMQVTKLEALQYDLTNLIVEQVWQNRS